VEMEKNGINCSRRGIKMSEKPHKYFVVINVMYF